jgi:8-oxo-dGTP diphosphatase
MSKITEVAAAVIQRPDGSFLLAQRPEGKPYSGYWEFPGGKIEQGENALACLKREIKEELDVEILGATPWITRVHAYTHATVRLHFFRVSEWSGNFQGMEDQAHTWQRVEQLEVGPMLPANTPIFRALSLPTIYAISNAAQLGVSVFLRRLETALQSGIGLIQVREKTLPVDTLNDLANDVVRRAHAAGARVLVNGDSALAQRVGADGIHVTAPQLAQLKERPDFPLVGASCHERNEIERAAALGLDFVVFGTVNRTPSHPGQPPLGWDAFREMVRDAPLPVYAIGGLNADDLSAAQACGAHGVALQRAAWSAA